MTDLEQAHRHALPDYIHNGRSECFIQEGLSHGNLNERKGGRLVLFLNLCVCRALFLQRLCVSCVVTWGAFDMTWLCISTSGKAIPTSNYSVAHDYSNPDPCLFSLFPAFAFKNRTMQLFKLRVSVKMNDSRSPFYE